MKVTTRKNPRLSINKLAEYMISDVLRRRQIVKDAKNPPAFKYTRYSEARETIKAFMCSGYDEQVVDDGIRFQNTRATDSDWQIDDVRNSIYALEQVRDMALPVLPGCRLESFADENTLVNLRGLDISVYPDLTVRNTKTGRMGAVKIHIARTSPLDVSALEYIATMLKYFYLNKGHKEKEIDDSLCIAVDVFKDNFTAAPKAYKRTISRISAACEEIVLWWDTI